VVSPARAAAIAWAFPTTALGLTMLPFVLLGGGRVRRAGGFLEAHGGALGRLLERGIPVRGIVAFTLGHVVVARDAASAEAWRAHERAHVKQSERWGPLFLPAYAAVALWTFARGAHPYRDHPFEREARAAAAASAPSASTASPAPDRSRGGSTCADPV
jgi:hypothetical protein